MITEDEARTKWCPFANVYVPYQNTGAAGNRGLSKDKGMQANEGSARCIASECMMWVATDNMPWPLNQHPSDASEPVYKPAGYCGLNAGLAKARGEQ